MQDRNTILLPNKAHGRARSHSTRLRVLRVFSFQSHTSRSGAVVLCDRRPPGSALLYLKGAPDVISRMVQPASVPPDFQQVTHCMHAVTPCNHRHRFNDPCLLTAGLAQFALAKSNVFCRYHLVVVCFHSLAVMLAHSCHTYTQMACIPGETAFFCSMFAHGLQ